MNERTFRPAEAHKLEDPERRKWLPVDAIIERLALRPGLRVADVGAGTGYFAIPMAHAVGAHGRVFAVDLQAEMLQLLRDKLDAATENLETAEGSAHQTNLPGESCDLVLLANVWHELDDHPGVLREAARLLRPEGRLTILDWRADAVRPPGPPIDHRWPVQKTVHMLEHNGWTVHDYGGIGSYHYLVVATPADDSVQS